jgi:branched-subunit amino acid transport protein
MNKNTNFLGSLFQAIADILNGAERSFLDLLSVIVPYAVPIIPAYLTYFHTRDQMAFPDWVAKTAAFVVEVLGITAVSTAIRFWRNNQLYKSDKERAPFWLAVAVYVFYIVIVLSVNVILEIVSGVRSGWVIFSIGLFSLLSFPSGVLISIRAQYTEMLEDRTERKQERQGTRHTPPFRPAYNSDEKQEELTTKEGNFRGKNNGS